MRGRMLTVLGALALVTLVLGVAPARSRADVIVPDDYPTIQAALDALQPLILVREGDYDEALVVHGSVEIRGLGYSDYVYSAPSIRGLTLSDPDIDLALVGIRARGSIRLAGGGDASSRRFEACRFDSGLMTLGYHSLVLMQGCTVYGGLHLECMGAQVYGCAIIGGGASVHGNERPVEVVGNYISGPAPCGVSVSIGTEGTPWHVRSNVITGTDVGVLAGYSVGYVEDNDITGCGSHGIAVVDSLTRSLHAIGNRIRDCGGAGIHVMTGVREHGAIDVDVRDNRIERTGGDGIAAMGFVVALRNTVLDAGGHGLRADSLGSGLRVLGNTVLRSALDGMRLPVNGPIDSNVVGRSGGDGIVVVRPAPGWRLPGHVRSNTSYANQRSGIAVTDVFAEPMADTVQSNILYGNGRYGLEWTGTALAALGCNDYYGNVLGGANGVSPAPDDLVAAPSFCDVALDDATLRGDSPLLAWPGCGRIGARAAGCAILAAPSDGPADGRLAFSHAPQPARGEVRFAWTPRAGAVRLEVFDLAGARRFERALPGEAGGHRWSGHGQDGRTLPAGVYYARLTAGDRAERRMVVLLP